MKKFDLLVNKLLENTTAMFGGIANTEYAAGDNRPIEPARIVIGAKYKKGKNQTKTVKVPIQRRPRIETTILRSK
jgi:hypothetical protein